MRRGAPRDSAAASRRPGVRFGAAMDSEEEEESAAAAEARRAAAEARRREQAAAAAFAGPIGACRRRDGEGSSSSRGQGQPAQGGGEGSSRSGGGGGSASQGPPAKVQMPLRPPVGAVTILPTASGLLSFTITTPPPHPPSIFAPPDSKCPLCRPPL